MKTAIISVLSALALGGCAAATSPPDVLAGADPANPASGKRKTHYHSVIQGYSHRVPVEPENWENDPDPPAAKGKGAAQ